MASDSDEDDVTGFKNILHQRQKASHLSHVERIRNLPSSQSSRQEVSLEVMRLKNQQAIARAIKNSENVKPSYYKPSVAALRAYSPYRNKASDYASVDLLEKQRRRAPVSQSVDAPVISENHLRELRELI